MIYHSERLKHVCTIYRNGELRTDLTIQNTFTDTYFKYI